MNNLLFLIHYNNGDYMYYFNIFFLYSFIGYILEYILYLICGYEGGILYGFWTPVYGIGSLIVFLFYNKFLYKINNHKIIKFLLTFLIGVFFLSLIEEIGGLLIDFIFNKSLWDYTENKYNIGKYVCLEMATLWGISSVILVYFLKDITDKIVKKIPKFITWILIVLFIIDLICTIIFKG